MVERPHSIRRYTPVSGIATFLLVAALLFGLTVRSVLHSARTEAQPLATRTVSSGSVDSTQDNPIQHIVIIVKENRSFDNYFGTFPGADGTRVGRTSEGRVVRLIHTPDQLLLDIGHAGAAARVAAAGGRMNGFARLPGALQDYSVYAAAIPASSTDPAAARAFIAALTSAAMAERWRANGFEPPK